MEERLLVPKYQRGDNAKAREGKAPAFLHAYWFHQIALLLLGGAVSIRDTTYRRHVL